MCGIVGYIGKKNATPIIIRGIGEIRVSGDMIRQESLSLRMVESK